MARLPLRRIFSLCAACRLKAKNGFALFHKIQTITRNRFQISHVSLEQIDLASLAREHSLLIVQLCFQDVDLGPALHQFFVRRHEQTDNHQPDGEDEEDAKNSIESLPNCGLATRAEIAVGLIHLTHLTAVPGFVTKFFLDPQKLVIFGSPVGAAKRASFDLAGVRRDRNVSDGGVFRLAGAMTDYSAIIIFLGQIDRRQRFCERADLVHLD